MLQVMLGAPCPCPAFFFVYKIILTKKIVVMFLFVSNIKMIGMLFKCLHRQVQKSKQKYVTERYGRLYSYSTLITMNAMKHVI